MMISGYDNILIDRENTGLFVTRSLLVFWLGIISYLLFAVLDYLVHPDLFPLFFTWRLEFACLLLICIGLLQFSPLHRFAPLIMTVALGCATLVVSLMITRLGGFRSEYYIGIILVTVFVFSILPLTIYQVTGLGLGMFLVYILTVWKSGGGREEDLVFLANNTFFYMAILVAAVITCHDDTRMRGELKKRREKLRHIQLELGVYTGNLEQLIQKRLKQIKELEFRYSELYDNIQDMVVTLDETGEIDLYNRRFAEVFQVSDPPGERLEFFHYIALEQRTDTTIQFREQFKGRHSFVGLEVPMQTGAGTVITVEISGNWMNLENGGALCQLVLRDITERREMERQVLESSRLVDCSRQSAIIGLAKLAEYRDDDTGRHLERIRKYTRMLTEKLAAGKTVTELITPTFLEDISISSVLHDIGKVGIPDGVLLKRGRLTAEEFEVMKKHSEYGSDALADAERDVGDVSFMTMAQEIAHFHHEKWDGSGYPLGLEGKNIPLSARIVALADVYDALTSKRCYKPPFTHEQAKEIIMENRGRHFDPDVVDAFLALEEEFRQVRLEMLLEDRGD